MVTEKTKQLEYNFSDEPISAKDIHAFCQEYIHYTSLWSFGDAKELEKALTQLCEVSPTARVALRATMYNVQQQRKTNPDYRIDLNIENSDTFSTFYGIVFDYKPNEINLFPKNMKREMQAIKKRYDPQDIYADEKETERGYNYLFAMSFLHEAQHIRQLQNEGVLSQKADLRLLDAGPQAFNRMVALETNNFYLRTTQLINKKEQLDFFDSPMGKKSSQKRQEMYGNDFLASIEDLPSFNHASLKNKWTYTRNDIFQNLLKIASKKEKGDALADYLRDVNHLSVPQNDAVKKHLTAYFEPQVNAFLKVATKKDAARLYLNILTEKELKKGDFSSDEVYELAKKINLDVMDLNKNMTELTIDSFLIHQEDFLSEDRLQEIKNESKKIREHLKNKYGILISPYNRKGERVAVQNEGDKTLDQTPVATEVNEGTNTRGDLLKTLAQNASSVPNDASDTVVVQQGGRASSRQA